MKKLRVRLKKGQLTCLCGNTTREDGWEEDRKDSCWGIYLMVCKRCGLKFDDNTFIYVGLRACTGYQNELVKSYSPRVMYQSTRYFHRKMQGILYWERLDPTDYL